MSGTCIYCLKPIKKRSKEHIIPECIGGKLVYPLICGECNNNLGSIVDSHWTFDCWMKFAQDQLGLKKFNFKSPLQVTDSQSKYTFTKLSNGKVKVNPPFTQPGAWRAVAKMAYEIATMIIGNSIFQGQFGGVRRFVKEGKLPAQKSEIVLSLDNGCSIVRVSKPTKLGPYHIFDIYNHNEEFLIIDLGFFNYYWFSATFKVDMKTIKSKTVKFPFRIAQELNPRKLFMCNWDEKQNKWEIIGGF